jgi:3-oxoacyl-[acyl-carrier-protein] synthase I
VLVFGFDAISRFVATGFNSLAALSPSGARPFDAARDGLTIGEGAAIALLTYREPYRDDIIIAGAGSSNDANHRTGPSRTGDGLFRAARAALHDAALRPADIGGIKCHGTATKYNDAMEAKAIVGLFGEAVPPCFSVKGALGHTSGAGSLVEILIAAECLRRRLVPPTAGFSILGVDEQIPVSASPQRLNANTMLCLSAGFGGINAAVVLTEAA